MARKKKEQSPPPGAPAWMATYGDMVTLVLSFFILLYSFSALDNQKFQRLVISLQGSLGALDGGNTISKNQVIDEGSQGEQTGPDSKQNEEDTQLYKIKQQLQAYLQEKNMEKQVTMKIDERGLTIRFIDTALFDLGKADLKPESVATLDKVSEVLRTIQNPVRVEGHTDDLPINTYRFPSNWELSTTRATTVVRYFIDHNFPGDRLSAMGYGEFRPVAPNNSEANRRLNRRIDVVVLREAVAEQQEPK